MTDPRPTGRWYGVVVLVLLVFAVGIVADRPFLLLATIPGVVFVAYSGVSRLPPVRLRVTRSVSDTAPAEGEAVEVTVTVRNVGDRTLPDVRLIDGTPALLPVTGGTARCAAVLRPGDSTTFSYTVDARRGIHRFDPLTAIARDVCGAREATTTVSAEADTEIICEADDPALPIHAPGRLRTGTHPTPDGGTGVEFHGVREYQRGDPPGRVDWHGFARTGELSTVEFREERAAAVTLCLDARETARRSAAPGQPHAVSRGIQAARELASALFARGDSVGLAAIGPEFCWLSPGRGIDHETRAGDLLATHPAFAADLRDERREVDAERQFGELRHRLGAEDLVVLLTPLADDAVTEVALSLVSDGHAVAVLSPDATTDESIGSRLARVERANRIRTLRRSGVAVADWSPDEPPGGVLGEALRESRGPRGRERWSS